MTKPGFAVATLLTCTSLFAQSVAEVNVDLANPGAPLAIDQIAPGQGGLSSDSIWADRAPEIRTLQPRIVRLFIQEYFDAMPAKGRYDWHKLDENGFGM